MTRSLNHRAGLSRRDVLKTLFCSSVAMALNVRPSILSAAEVDADGALNLLAVGDFGTGKADQAEVAAAMQKYIADHKLKTEGLLLLGDNFYGKMEGGLKSERWQTGFETMYPPKAFPGPCWSILGNHDYGDNLGGEKTQLAYSKQGGTRWTMPHKWYRQEFGGKDPLVTMLFVDSNPPAVINADKDDDDKPAKKKASDAKGKDGKKAPSGPKPSLTAEEEAEQLEWLKAELAKPRGKFTVVVGHHPLYSNGQHGDTQRLIDTWGPLFQQHNVHAYLCGHDHDMQHLELEGKKTSFIVSGGGGQRVRAMKNNRPAPYARDVHGFTHIQIKPDALVFRHIGTDGMQLHGFSKSADGKVATV